VNKSTSVFEILKWKSKSGVSDKEMISAIDAMVSDLNNVKGFLHQSLYKNPNDEWIDIYYWETEQDANDSNSAMADKLSFKNLIGLIEPNTISIDVMQSLQASGELFSKK